MSLIGTHRNIPNKTRYLTGISATGCRYHWLEGILQVSAWIVFRGTSTLSTGSDKTDRRRPFDAHWFCSSFHKLLVRADWKAAHSSPVPSPNYAPTSLNLTTSTLLPLTKIYPGFEYWATDGKLYLAMPVCNVLNEYSRLIWAGQQKACKSVLLLLCKSLLLPMRV